jgi:hypothetical protein
MFIELFNKNVKKKITVLISHCFTTNDVNNTKGFVQKSGETKFSIAATAKHKSKIETIGAIQYGEMTKLGKWAKWRNLNMEIIYLCDNNLIIIKKY